MLLRPTVSVSEGRPLDTPLAMHVLCYAYEAHACESACAGRGMCMRRDVQCAEGVHAHGTWLLESSLPVGVRAPVRAPGATLVSAAVMQQAPCGPVTGLSGFHSICWLPFTAHSAA